MSAEKKHDLQPTLVEGNQLRCPNCEQLGDPLVQFKPLDRSVKYEAELNVVQQHRRDKGGCGHVFSPGESWIMEEYLAGNLIPKTVMIELKRKIVELEAIINERREITV